MSFLKRRGSYWFSELNWQFPLSIFGIALTAWRITVKCSNATWPVGIAGVHGPRHFAQCCIRGFFSWSEWQQTEKSSRLQQNERQGLAEGRCLGGLVSTAHLLFPHPALLWSSPLPHLQSVKRKKTISSLLTGAFTVILSLPGVKVRQTSMYATLKFLYLKSIIGFFL